MIDPELDEPDERIPRYKHAARAVWDALGEPDDTYEDEPTFEIPIDEIDEEYITALFPKSYRHLMEITAELVILSPGDEDYPPLALSPEAIRWLSALSLARTANTDLTPAEWLGRRSRDVGRRHMNLGENYLFPTPDMELGWIATGYHW